MDTSMTDESKGELNLKDYIAQYTGHQRFTRLLSIIEGSGSNNLKDV